MISKRAIAARPRDLHSYVNIRISASKCIYMAQEKLWYNMASQLKSYKFYASQLSSYPLQAIRSSEHQAAFIDPPPETHNDGSY